MSSPGWISLAFLFEIFSRFRIPGEREGEGGGGEGGDRDTRRNRDQKPSTWIRDYLRQSSLINRPSKLTRGKRKCCQGKTEWKLGDKNTDACWKGSTIICFFGRTGCWEDAMVAVWGSGREVELWLARASLAGVHTLGKRIKEWWRRRIGWIKKMEVGEHSKDKHWWFCLQNVLCPNDFI